MIKIKFISDFHGSTPEFQNKKEGEELITTAVKAKALVNLGVASIVEENIEETKVELTEEKSVDHAALIIAELSGTPNWEKAKRYMEEYLNPPKIELAKTEAPKEELKEEPKEEKVETKTEEAQKAELAKTEAPKEEKQRPPRDKRGKEDIKTK